MSDRLVHEEIIVKGETGLLTNPIQHWPRQDLSSFLKKADRYSTLGGQELYNLGGKISFSSSVTHSLWSFFFNYFLRRGFLDGEAGLLIAIADSIDTFFKYSKCWELQINCKKKAS